MGIGKQLKKARLAAGHTQESLAEAVGVSKGAIGNYENEVSHPKEEILYALIRVLGVDANYLFLEDLPWITGSSTVSIADPLSNLTEENRAKAQEYISLLEMKQGK